MELGDKQKNGRSIFRTILVPMMILLLVETAFLLVVPTAGGIFDEMDHNKEEILEQQVKNRRNHLENYMTNIWSDLSRLSEEITSISQSVMDERELTMEELQQDPEEMEQLLHMICDTAIEELYLKRASGIYVMFNTQDLRPARIQGQLPECSGLYIRDFDPETAPSARHGDLILVRGPRSVAYAENLKTTPDWLPTFTFGAAENPANYDFLYQPFQAAYETNLVRNNRDFGYWAPGTACWYGGTEKFVTYSQPLMLEDGTVYGVLGVELLDDDLLTMMPHADLYLDQNSTYVLAKVHRKWTTLYLENVLVGGKKLDQELLTSNLPLEPIKGKKNSYQCVLNDVNYYISAQSLDVYGENAPYVRQEWMLMGFAEENELYQLSQRIRLLLGLATLCMLLSGVLGSLVISRRLSGPIQRLAEDLSNAETNMDDIPELPATKIYEIDRFTSAISALSREVVHASTRFLRIIEMAAGQIGGFEIRKGEKVFVTENFFEMLGIQVGEDFNPTEEQFREMLENIHETLPHTSEQENSCVYKVESSETHEIRYARVSVTRLDSTMTGIVEDVTNQIMEKKRIEHDRDYDLLTRLLNRRAFYREVEQVFRSEDGEKCAAIIMMDLDDLKKVNDRYGHDWGDQYIQQAVRGFVASAPKNALLARLGGDEFALFVYGYETQEAVERAVEEFRQGVADNRFGTPEGGSRQVRVSCGVAWYPQDSRDFKELMKFADFAMYQIKRSVKGSLGAFDRDSFQQQTCMARKRKELREILDQQQVQYHFQPIFSAKDGSVYAYEALMRVNGTLIHGPDTLLELAREENRMADIERITMLKSMEFYSNLLSRGEADEKAYLFVNSLADQLIGEEDQRTLEMTYETLTPRVVIEITESSSLDEGKLEQKRKLHCFSGFFALDDYGTGYNGEKNLMELAPKYVKADICIIRGIDTDQGKQHILMNLLSYAHQRDMMVVAEGVETLGELQKCLELGADLFQGYALARPGAVPPPIERSALNVIRYYRQEENS